MEELALALGGQLGAGGLGDVAVAVPFYVGDVVLGEHVVHLLEDVVPHVLAGHVQHVLLPGDGGHPALGADGPVGMGAVQIAVGADHLRLVPDAELDSQVVHPLNQVGEPAFQLLLVDPPVAQGPLVVVAVAKPAVVHHQHVDAQLFGALGELHQLVVVKVEVGGLPAVDEQGALLFGPLAAAQVVQVEVVEGAAHAAQAGVGVDQHSLGRLEALAGLQAPAEVRGVDAQQRPGAALGVHFNVNGEVAAVDQVHAPGLALLLGGGVAAQGHKGVVVGARHAPLGLDALQAVLQGVAHGGVLLVPLAVDVDHVQIHGGQLQAGAERPLQGEGRAAGVLQAHALGQDGVVFKDGVQQGGL